MFGRDMKEWYIQGRHVHPRHSCECATLRQIDAFSVCRTDFMMLLAIYLGRDSDLEALSWMTRAVARTSLTPYRVVQSSRKTSL